MAAECENCDHYNPKIKSGYKGYCERHGCYIDPDSTPQKEGCKSYK